MTHVVTEACINCRYTDCVQVCPVECFHAGPNFLVINPDVCIDCALCVAECPVSAIMADCDLEQDQASLATLNAELAAAWPVIASMQAPLADAGVWREITPKLHLLQR